ncbi:vomeronasal type-2 receptor 26-like [Hyla sarda]|uniref:vomeronasal type-2 receptor 26-like n=1 Tax=Hyla sarda TaxID=327740 RepID=UPI0024C2999B|nr:vomeronasal type-2 receptor 26-like [Hyla sarda]
MEGFKIELWKSKTNHELIYAEDSLGSIPGLSATTAETALLQNHHVHNIVITKLLKHFDWTWVGISVSDDDAGENELQIQTKYMREHGICVAYTITLSEKKVLNNEQILQTLKNPKVSVIIMCGTYSENGVQLVISDEFLLLNKTLILPPSWAFTQVTAECQYTEFNLSLAVDFSSQHSLELENFVKNYRKLPNIYNDETFWTEIDLIAINGDKDALISCNGLDEMDNVTYKFTLPSLRKYLSSGVSPSSYVVIQILVSRCSDPCLPGSRKKARKSIHTCCYDCVPCSEGEISNITDSENCMKCPSDEWPNEKRDQCLPKVMDFISYQNDTMASVFSCVSIFGCLLTGSIFRIFISYRDTPIVKANNRNLSYLLLVSILLSFLSVFFFLGRPSDISCRLRETSFGIFFSVAVSSLLAKTIMVCVAFKSTKPGSPWRKWLSVKLPYTIVLLCSSFQVVLCVIWLSISPPFQDLDTQSYPGKIIIQCNTGSNIWFYSVLGYLGFLAAVSFVLAFMVRTLPDTFNEAKYITFSMLLLCSVWIAMIPAYLSTTGKSMVAMEIFAVIASSAGLLVCVFFPKCFIILFKPEMNRKMDMLGKRKE